MNCDQCPHRGERAAQSRREWTEEQLRQACIDAGEVVLIGGRVREATAARILDRAEGTLRNWRAQARPIPFHLVGGRAYYTLSDLAEYLNLAARE